MIDKHAPSIPSFSDHIHKVAPIIHQHLSGYLHKKIAFSKYLSANKTFIVSLEDADAGCITVEDFLSVLINRIDKELAYKKELIELGEQIFEELNKFYAEANNHDFKIFLKNQTQIVIDFILDRKEVKAKMVGEKFLTDLINGFETTALSLENFYETFYTIIWKPFLVPFPIGVLTETKKFLGELNNDKSTHNVKEMVTKLKEHIEKHMKPEEYKDTEFNDTDELKLKLGELRKERKICNIEMRDFVNNQQIICQFKKECIEKLTIISEAQKFLENEIEFPYDELIFTVGIHSADFENVMKKVQSQIKKLEIICNAENESECKLIQENLTRFVFLNSLNLSLCGSTIGEVGALALFSTFKCLKNLSRLDLNLWQNRIGDQGIIAFSADLIHLTKISSLTFNFELNNITEEGAKAFGEALKNLKNIEMLMLGFGDNGIGPNGAESISVALKNLKKIRSLDLYFGYNCIKDEGLKYVSSALTELKNISSLTLNLLANSVGSGGLQSVPHALKELINISSFNFDLRGNYIGSAGAKVVSECLKHVINASELTLALSDNNIEDDGIIAILNVLNKFKNLSSLNLYLENNCIEDKGRTGLDALAAQNSKFSIYY